MKTATDNQQRVAKLKYTQTKETENLRIRATVQLADDCRNGHEDFSVTGETWEKYDGRWREGSCGCIHEEISEHFPELRQFIPLHLSAWQGIPVYGVENGFYWFQGLFADGLGNKHHPGTGSSARTPDQCRAILLEHLRCNDDELNAIIESCPRTKEEFSHVLETMGFRARWKEEAKEAIKKLEALAGAKFEAVGPRQTWKPLDVAQIGDIKAKQESGYYTPENVAKRDAQKSEAARLAKIESIKKDYAARVDKLEREKLIKLYFATRGIDDSNIIFYDHTNELTANWSNCSKLWTREEWDKLTASIEMSEMPSGIIFRFQEKPRF